MLGKKFIFITLLSAAWIAPSVAQAQVNYHQAQQAGKVWGDKIGENNRQDAKARNAKKNSQGIRYDAPLTTADMEAAKARKPADYQRLYDSVGKKNADRWLEFEARRLRASQ